MFLDAAQVSFARGTLVDRIDIALAGREAGRRAGGSPKSFGPGSPWRALIGSGRTCASSYCRCAQHSRCRSSSR
jgi:hypothetical protein